jgi:hypothetical protein
MSLLCYVVHHLFYIPPIFLVKRRTARQTEDPGADICTYYFDNETSAIEIDVAHAVTNCVAPEPEGSSPHSQQPANGPYPEPAESTPHTPNQSP